MIIKREIKLSGTRSNSRLESYNIGCRKAGEGFHCSIGGAESIKVFHSRWPLYPNMISCRLIVVHNLSIILH